MKIHEMRLCEQSRVMLKPNLAYRFTIDPKCQACCEAAERVGVSPWEATQAQTPTDELRNIAEMLQEWLTDNTEHVFEDEPLVDNARNLLLEHIGDL